jgi:hypothetical protein
MVTPAVVPRSHYYLRIYILTKRKMEKESRTHITISFIKYSLDLIDICIRTTVYLLARYEAYLRNNVACLFMGGK